MKVDAEVFAKQAPLFGPYLAYGGLVCKYFETPKATEVLPTKTANPIVIIGTTGDPATPYEWVIGLHKILTTSMLFSLDADGHTGQGRGSICIDDAVNFYLMHGKPPEKNLTCRLR
jgi:hypothetical protein